MVGEVLVEMAEMTQLVDVLIALPPESLTWTEYIPAPYLYADGMAVRLWLPGIIGTGISLHDGSSIQKMPKIHIRGKATIV
jgi:hypothetical protein